MSDGILLDYQINKWNNLGNASFFVCVDSLKEIVSSIIFYLQIIN